MWNTTHYLLMWKIALENWVRGIKSIWLKIKLIGYLIYSCTLHSSHKKTAGNHNSAIGECPVESESISNLIWLLGIASPYPCICCIFSSPGRSSPAILEWIQQYNLVLYGGYYTFGWTEHRTVHGSMQSSVEHRTQKLDQLENKEDKGEKMQRWKKKF